MQTSITLSELAPEAGSRASDLLRLIGHTPTIRLERSGEGRVLLKHEGYNPSGSFFDRVAHHALAALDLPPRATVLVDNADAFALAVVTIGGQLGVKVHVLADAGTPGRLHKLIALHGGTLEVVSDATRADVRAALVADGAVEVIRSNAEAILAALSDVAEEIVESGARPQLWVLPDYGVDPEALQSALAAGRAEAPYLELISDDREQTRTLSGPDACRRSQTGQREGVLLSPLGAEIVEAAVNAAPEVDGQVVALLPEGGQRYLGWW